MDKQQWNLLKMGIKKPENPEEQKALEEYKKDRMLAKAMKDSLFIPLTTRDRREGLWATYRKDRG